MRMVAPRTGAPEVTLAEEQMEYRPLVAARYVDEAGAQMLLTRWRLDDEERALIAAGDDVYLAVMTFGRPLQPVILQVGPEGWKVGE